MAGFIEQFTAANGTLWTALAQPWTVGGGTWDVQTNEGRIVVPVATFQGNHAYRGDLGLNGKLALKIRRSDAGTNDNAGCGIMIRSNESTADPPSHGYLYRVFWNTTFGPIGLAIERYSGGVGDFITFAGAYALGTTVGLKIIARDDVIKFFNWDAAGAEPADTDTPAYTLTETGSFSDQSVRTTRGVVKVRVSTEAATAGDFRVDDLAFTDEGNGIYPYKVADRGTVANVATGLTSSVPLAAGGAIAVGNYLVARVGADNSGTGGVASGLTVSDARGNSWTVTASANQDPGLVNEGSTCYIAYAKVTNPYSNGDNLTFTWGITTLGKSIVVEEWGNMDRVSPLAVAATTAVGASGTPSIARTPLAAGQLVYCALAIEGPTGDAYTVDADLTEGSWQPLTSLSTADGTATNNQTIRGAAKVVTGTTAQTWNPTITSRDWAAVALVFAPRFSADPPLLPRRPFRRLTMRGSR